MKSTTAPQLEVREARRGFSWVDGVVLLALLTLLWSALHFGKGMLVHFDASAQSPLGSSIAEIPYYASARLEISKADGC